MTRDQLEKRLRKYPLIAIGAGWGRLLKRNTKVEAIAGVRWAADALKAYEQFAELVDAIPDRRSFFRVADVARIAGVTPQNIHIWCRSKILPRKYDRFTFTGAYVAGLAGAARRQGVPLDTLANIAPVILGEDVGQPGEDWSDLFAEVRTDA